MSDTSTLFIISGQKSYLVGLVQNDILNSEKPQKLLH